MDTFPYESIEPHIDPRTAELLPDAIAVFHQIDSLLSLHAFREPGNHENVRIEWTHHDKGLHMILESNVSFHPVTHIMRQDMSASLVTLDSDHPGLGKVWRLEFIIPGEDVRDEIEMRYNETPFAEQRYDIVSERVEWRSADGRPHKSELTEGILAYFEVGLSLMKSELAK